jgi:hypothetical protein
MASQLERELSELNKLVERGVLSEEEAKTRRAALVARVDTSREVRRGGFAVLVLTIVGAVLGVLFGLFAIALATVGGAFEVEGVEEVRWLGLSAIAASAFAVLCAGLYYAGVRRGLMSLGLLVAAIWHLISISLYAIPGSLFFGIAALVAFLRR